MVEGHPGSIHDLVILADDEIFNDKFAIGLRRKEYREDETLVDWNAAV